MPNKIAVALPSEGPESFIKLFAFRAEEFLDDELLLIVARLAKKEGKTRDEITREIETELDFRTSGTGPYKYQLWGTLDLLARIHKAKDVAPEGAAHECT